MQQIFNFIFKNSHRMLFLLLLGIAISLTVQSHSYHRSKIITSSNMVSGAVYEQVSSVNAYIDLKTKNEELALENGRLKSILFNLKDSLEPIDYTAFKGLDQIDIINSNIIKNKYSTRENFLTINSGTKVGVLPDMGVINSLGIVGIVENTSENYSTVISILNTKSQINAKIKKSNHFGSLIWNGKSTGFVQLIDVPRLASVRKGDTIVTGGQSTIFPENINIGTIDKIYTDNQTNFFTINVRLFNDMTSLGHVYLIKNKTKPEFDALEKKNKNEQ